MNLLLDTHMLLWAAEGSLPRRARKLIADEDNALYFSPASIWEIGIKRNLGRDDFQVDPAVLYRALVDNGYREIPVDGRHAIVAAEMPTLHKDPFDRMLLAQAKCEGFTLLTSDDTVRKYPGSILFIPKA